MKTDTTTTIRTTADHDMNGSDLSALSDDLVGFIRHEVAPESDIQLATDTDLVMSGLVDSLGVMMIVEWLERRLHVTIDPGDVVIEHFSSVDAIIQYLDGSADTTPIGER